MESCRVPSRFRSHAARALPASVVEACGRAAAAKRWNRGVKPLPVMKFEVAANIGEQMLFEPIISGCTHVSKITLAPSNPICASNAQENPAREPAPISPHTNAEPFRDMALHLRAEHQLGCNSATRASTSR